MNSISNTGDQWLPGHREGAWVWSAGPASLPLQLSRGHPRARGLICFLWTWCPNIWDGERDSSVGTTDHPQILKTGVEGLCHLNELPFSLIREENRKGETPPIVQFMLFQTWFHRVTFSNCAGNQISKQLVFIALEMEILTHISSRLYIWCLPLGLYNLLPTPGAHYSTYATCHWLLVTAAHFHQPPEPLDHLPALFEAPWGWWKIVAAELRALEVIGR